MKIRFFAVAMLALVAGIAFAGDSAEEMLAKIKAVQNPQFDAKRQNEKGYAEEYMGGVKKANEERGKLILDFFKAYPDNEDAEKLMNQRWAAMMMYQQPTPELLKSINTDIDAVLASNPPAKVKQDGSYWKAKYGIVNASPEHIAELVDGFLKAYPADPRDPQLLASAAEASPTKKGRRDYYARIAKDYKDSPSAKYAPGIVRQIDSVGQPFDLTFTDAISGKQISMKDLKGKVVLLDFWATWCGPCVAKMPEMKKLYADLHDKGLEVVGISLDQPEDKGGLTALKDFVAKNGVAWPQYYQGNFWSSEFSTSWGINSIPCVFLIDKNGKLAEVTYPEGLDEKIKKLLAG